jgi:hypothetical protein
VREYSVHYNLRNLGLDKLDVVNLRVGDIGEALMRSGGKSDKSTLGLLVGVVYAASLKMRPGQRIRIRAYVV